VPLAKIRLLEERRKYKTLVRGALVLAESFFFVLLAPQLN
jgi:hypothetical protein